MNFGILWPDYQDPRRKMQGVGSNGYVLLIRKEPGMANEFAWKKEYSLGVETLDKEHERLFRIINKLLRIDEENKKDSKWACEQTITYFKQHALQHFGDEEAYMASIGYPGLSAHTRIHDMFRDRTLPALEKELIKEDYSPTAIEHFIGVCAGWLIGHTLTEDLAITGKSSSRWGHALDSEETRNIQTVIKQLVFDMFRTEMETLSDAYGGESFGRSIYYRLIYDTGVKGKKQEVLLAFEERLLIDTIGSALGIKTNRMDGMIMHAARYTARQFVQRFFEQFPDMEMNKFVEETLLTHGQLERIFEREKMQVSLLFGGEHGYFGFSMIAPHLLAEDIGQPLEHETAVNEVEKYLRNNEATAEKAKILIVDDSMTVRHKMRELLEAKYNVSLASSGLSAIRSIVLNHPDLVLMDYEMPVCDGRQTLEMLRADDTLQDIRVVFLTGRSDPDTVRQVMALKPLGYLLKTLKSDEIKSKIDGFMEKIKKQRAKNKAAEGAAL